MNITLLRHKWDARVPMTQAEIAALLGCSRGTIHGIEQRALEKIRAAVEKREKKWTSPTQP